MILERVGDKKAKQDGKYDWNRVIPGANEIQCVIQQNNVNPYEIYNNYIELSIVFHIMIIFLGNRKI